MPSWISVFLDSSSAISFLRPLSAEGCSRRQNQSAHPALALQVRAPYQPKFDSDFLISACRCFNSSSSLWISSVRFLFSSLRRENASSLRARSSVRFCTSSCKSRNLLATSDISDNSFSITFFSGSALSSVDLIFVQVG